tara:strand:- start:68359 stop:68853 length:495 start_codon:yes stop_codon:yes gene_type:complete
MSQQTKNINAILTHDGSSLSQLISRAKALNALHEKIETVIGEKLKNRYKLGSYQKGTLSLLTDNGSTATELRYSVPEIVQLLRQDPMWVGLIKIQVKVHHDWHEYEELKKPLPKPEVAEPLSTKTLTSLQILADSLKDDPKNQTLEKSIRKLIASSKKRKNNSD